MLHLLERLDAAGGLAISFYMPPGLADSEIERTLSIVAGTAEALLEITSAAARSETGAVLFWGEEEKSLVLPPFSITEKLFCSSYDVEALRSLLKQELMVALILLRLGAYAIGVFQGDRLVSSKVGTGHIHARHKKGGSSQQRFARGRQKQIEFFFDSVCGRVRERLEPYVGQLDYMVYGGERNTLLSFRRRCEFLKSVNDRVMRRTLNVRTPKQATLEAAIEEVWASEVISWREVN
ncbi:MAG: hypothetical protein JSW38_10925 [Dehalococcoidia bacterium]|nr:MAG: hypothetical protein JSW38_10925 [Dehalococcoidia bacterium]